MAPSSSSPRFVGLESPELLEMVRGGDQEAYGELYVRYHGFAHRVAKRASRRHADDLVSEAFRRVLTAITRGAGPTQAFGPYLATTIRSAAAGLDPRVSTAFMSLPETWQNALWYTDVEGMAPRHAAPLMGLKPNALSALRIRARAGLRSAYLTQVVDDACNEEVRHHLALLIAGKADPEAVDAMVDEHLESCDTCGAIAWRIAAVSGSKLGVTLAPALLAFHGFGAVAALLPKAVGLAGLLGWLRQSPGQAAAGAVAVAVAVLAVVGLAVAADRGQTDESVDGVASTEDVAPPVGTEPSAATTSPVTSPSSTNTSTSTTSSSTTSTTSTSTPTSTTSTPPQTLPLIVALPTTTFPPIVTTPSNLLGTVPVATTTTSSTTSTTVPTGTTTTTTTTTTTIPATTTTTTTTVPTTTTTTTVPVPSPGALQVVSDQLVGANRRVLVQVQLSGAPGSLRFSNVSNFIGDSNATCSGTTCVLDETAAPGVAEVDARVDAAPVTIELLDASGAVRSTYTSP